jgi:hypothetical protein
MKRQQSGWNSHLSVANIIPSGMNHRHSSRKRLHSSGMTPLPEGMVVLPAGKRTIPSGTTSIPAGKYLNQLRISSLLFGRCKILRYTTTATLGQAC